ncbi:MAG: hypothetical protein SFX18_09045 [Pirellulales bacterium]|nr:hypothetical protein [Pirellulales bacterium]
MTFPRFSETGVWQPESVLLIDSIGNTSHLTASDLLLMGIDTRITVTGISDLTPPNLTNITIDRDTINTFSSSQTVAFTWHLSDDLSGLPGPSNSSPTQMRLRSPSGNQFVTSVLSQNDLVSGNLLDGTFRDTVTFPRFSETGVWHLEYLFLIDNNGNSRTLYLNELNEIGIDIEILVVPEPRSISIFIATAICLYISIIQLQRKCTG